MRTFSLGLAIGLSIGCAFAKPAEIKTGPLNLDESGPMTLWSAPVAQRVSFGEFNKFDAVNCELVRECPKEHMVVTQGEFASLRKEAGETSAYLHEVDAQAYEYLHEVFERIRVLEAKAHVKR